ncbi:MAG: S8 family peptidase [Rhodobiaceae bacterium]|nr:S8 family peptidase [Rhodobiaceae bacterium]
MELEAALKAADAAKPLDDRLPTPEGTFIEVDLFRGSSTDKLERKKDGIRPAAVKATDNNERTVALYVPDHAREALKAILEDYTSGPLTAIAENPPNNGVVSAIDGFRQARLETFWTDHPDALPDDSTAMYWWALWCRPEGEGTIESCCQRLKLRAASKDQRLYFPETTVIPVLAPRSAIELMLFMTAEISELRRANDNPTFFTDEVRGAQHEWVDDLASRIVWPASDAPAVCLLDTGVNRGHALIEPALSPNDLHSVNKVWGNDDHSLEGHGTAMAGLALHGNLTAQLADQSERILAHRLESVKILPPNAFDENEPHSYGVLTLAGISQPEISQPNRPRVFCMAVSNRDVSGSIPSAWSAAIDQAAAGTNLESQEDPPKRLFVLSVGNIPPEIDPNRLQPQDNYPAEDPSQAWNALSVGGYTDFNEVFDPGYESWSPVVNAGEISPHSRTSATWPQSKAPFKPELVLEAGNRAINSSRTETLTTDSLSLLSTGAHIDQEPLVPFQATSAAAAQAARMAAELSAAHPDYWPETLRALLVHSAEWTAPMLSEFEGSNGKTDNYRLVRRFGYGVPDFDRANASAQNHLAIVSQSAIQPFLLKGTRRFNECHYYQLPFPQTVLEQLNNEVVELKITLSYFVDPNPGLSANVEPQRYRSHGLRFDLQRLRETTEVFKERVNTAERTNSKSSKTWEADDDRWMLGPKSVSAGSLHCDVWRGPAIELLGRSLLCIKPVAGWYRDRSTKEHCNRKTRYSLVITMKTADVGVDLHTPITAMLSVPTSIKTPV